MPTQTSCHYIVKKERKRKTNNQQVLSCVGVLSEREKRNIAFSNGLTPLFPKHAFRERCVNRVAHSVACDCRAECCADTHAANEHD